MFWTILTSSPSKTFSPLSLQFLTCPTECIEIAAHSFQTSQILKRHAKLEVVHAIPGCLTKLSVREVKDHKRVKHNIDDYLKPTKGDKFRQSATDLKHALEVIIFHIQIGKL